MLYEIFITYWAVRIVFDILLDDQSPEDFKAALGELRIIVENGMKRARGENVEEYTGEETPSATGLPKVRVYDPTTGTFK